MNAERREESAALQALGLLDAGEAVWLELEQRRDPALRELVDDLLETTAHLALLAKPALPAPSLRGRVLATAAHSRSPAPAAPRALQFKPQPWLMAASLALLAGYLGWSAHSVFAPPAKASEEVVQAAQAEVAALRAQLEHQHAQASSIIAELRRQADVAELKVTSLASLLGNSPEAQAIAIWNPLTQEGVLTVVNLPALEAGKDYQLWLIDPQYDIPVDGGVFRVDPATGEARVSFRPDRPVSLVEKFAVSLEKAGGVPKAEGPMVLISP